MDQAYLAILAWLDKEFPGATYPSEHWPKGDASKYLPAGWSVPSELAHEPIEVFVKRNARPPAPRKELVVVRRALVECGASVVVASLRSQAVAGRLRKAPAVRLLLDRDLMVRPWGRFSTGGATGVGGTRN
jgi:hypothetical protein